MTQLKATPGPNNAFVCRMVGADFDAREITLRVQGACLLSIVSGNYVVLPQQDFAELRAALALARGEQS